MSNAGLKPNTHTPTAKQGTTRKLNFPGFAPPTSNTTYTPNQFFDVLIPNASRGCIRIVAYLLRKTLGWCDSFGNPQREHIRVSNTELERHAGVGHDLIRSALNEAIDHHFIECVQQGRPRTAGDPGLTAIYSLKWDATPRYARTLEEFRGFYEGEGHRTDIPNQFFDVIIPNETLAVIKVVSSVIRYSIGFVARRGHRRQHATLAYSQILKVSGLSSRRTLAGAIREAIAKRYVVRIEPGYFSARISERRTAVYAVCWTDGFHLDHTITPKRIPGELWITPSGKDTSGAPDHSDPATCNTPERIPAGHSGKDTIETKPLNEKAKQAAELLRREGFGGRTADTLARRYPDELIRRQIKWLPLRNASKSRTGLLRRAIEGDWPEPRREKPPREPLQPGYLAWLREQHRTYKEQEGAEFERFADKRERTRRDLSNERNPRLREHLLREHDSEIAELTDFQRFLALPDAHQWASAIINETNPNNS